MHSSSKVAGGEDIQTRFERGCVSAKPRHRVHPFRKVLLAMVLTPLMAMAYEEKVGTVVWSFDIVGGKASVTKANPATGSIVIPDRLGGYPVMSIGEKAFMRCDR